jgi:hypothetical protein
MSRKVTLAQKKSVAGKQRFKCNNKPDSNLAGLNGYKCQLWMINDDNKGCFDDSGYDIDHIEEWSINKNDDTDNLQALCLSCHRVKTKNFLMHRKNNSEIDKENTLSKKKILIKLPDNEKFDKYKVELNELSLSDLNYLFFIVIGKHPSNNNKDKLISEFLGKIFGQKRNYKINPILSVSIIDSFSIHTDIALVFQQINNDIFCQIEEYLSSCSQIYIPAVIWIIRYSDKFCRVISQCVNFKISIN